MVWLVKSIRSFCAASVIIGLTLACSKSKSDATANAAETETVAITGTVKYTRIPLVTNAQGLPTGLEADAAKFTQLPVRGARVRLYTTVDQTDAAGKTIQVLALAEEVNTTYEGKYTFSHRPKKGGQAFVEVLSRFFPGAIVDGASGSLRIVGDPQGINSPLHQSDRVLYSLRKGVAGKTSTTDPVPTDTVTVDATVNFEVGLNQRWWLVPETGKLFRNAVLETGQAGSRPLGIADSFMEFVYRGGSASLETILDLHYVPGRSEPRGTYVEFDSTVYPQALEPGYGSHAFGSIRGGADNDDAWDEGVLFPLFARCRMYPQFKTRFLPIQPVDPSDPGTGAELTGLTPDSAHFHACPDALAALILKSPYLADVRANGVVVRDIRDAKGAPKDIFSAPNLRAMLWDLILKANGITKPGVKEDWAKIDSSSLIRYFNTVLPKNGEGVVIDIVSAYSQLARLKEAKVAAETIDLAAIFTDAVLTDLVKDYGIVWPRPTTGALSSFLTILSQDWAPATGATHFFQPMSLSMALAQKDGLDKYPGHALGQRFYATALTSKDQVFYLNVAPAPPAGSVLEVNLGPISRTILPTESADPYDQSKRIVIPGNATTPITNFVMFKLVSPDTKQNYTFTWSLLPPR